MTPFQVEVFLIYDSVQLLVLAIKELLANGSIPFDTHLHCGSGTGYTFPLGKQIKDTMISIGSDDRQFITKDLHFNEFDERIGFELEIFKPIIETSFATWNTNGEIKPIDLQASSITTKKNDPAAGKPTYTIAIRIVSPYFMKRLVVCCFVFIS